MFIIKYMEFQKFKTKHTPQDVKTKGQIFNYCVLQGLCEVREG